MPEAREQPMTATAQDVLSTVADLPLRPEKNLVNAPLWRRGGAYVIDLSIIFPFYLFFFFLLTTTPVPQEERVTVTVFVGVTAAILVLISVGYFVYFEARGGATLGKRVTRVYVVDDDGGECTIKQSILRAILRPVDILTWPVVFLGSKRQRLGDRLAKTWVVIKE